MSLGFLMIAVLAATDVSQANETMAGHLVIIGGGLQPHNAAIYDRLIEYSGGTDKARIAIIPTASRSTADAERFARVLVSRGITRQQIEFIDITEKNASNQTSNPAVVEQISRCTGVYFGGGDQHRLTRALMKPDGSDTPVLAAVRDVWKRGGMISGSSAGAAAQAQTMIRVSGLPDETLDGGMDALDFGVTSEPLRRGVLLSKGLGFFRGGLIDQHFSQYRGRLGRLARAIVASRDRFGFGIDEDTSLDVAPDGTIEIVGNGHVTVVDAEGVRFEDGPMGCRLSDLKLDCLAARDRFDLKIGQAIVAKTKTAILKGMEDWNGNIAIPDISGPQAVIHALIDGLANNTSSRQVGISLRYNRNYGHGYQFTFSKVDKTHGYSGDINGKESFSLVGVRLNIHPVVATLKPSWDAMPPDLPTDAARTSVEACAYRGILLTDGHHRFNPGTAITRAELANAIVHTIHLEPSRHAPPRLEDIEPDSPESHDAALVVAAGLLQTDDQGRFRPQDPISRLEAAGVFVRLAERYLGRRLECDPISMSDDASIQPDACVPVFAAIRAQIMTLKDDTFSPGEPLKREDAAVALCRIIGFSWLNEAKLTAP